MDECSKSTVLILPERWRCGRSRNGIVFRQVCKVDGRECNGETEEESGKNALYRKRLSIRARAVCLKRQGKDGSVCGTHGSRSGLNELSARLRAIDRGFCDVKIGVMHCLVKNILVRPSRLRSCSISGGLYLCCIFNRLTSCCHSLYLSLIEYFLEL